MQQQTKIILFFIGLFLTSSAYLFAIDSRYNDPVYNSDWYALSFIEPKSDSLDFAIENFSAGTYFHWELLVDKKTINSDDLEIQTSEKKELSLPEISIADKKYTIRVYSGDATQEIYKN